MVAHYRLPHERVYIQITFSLWMLVIYHAGYTFFLWNNDLLITNECVCYVYYFLLLLFPLCWIAEHLCLLIFSSECLPWFLLIFPFSFLYHDCLLFFSPLFLSLFSAPSFVWLFIFTRAPRPTRPMLASLLLAIIAAFTLTPQPIFFLFLAWFNIAWCSAPI